VLISVLRYFCCSRFVSTVSELDGQQETGMRNSRARIWKVMFAILNVLSESKVEEMGRASSRDG
jgi:hypothetical protein